LTFYPNFGIISYKLEKGGYKMDYTAKLVDLIQTAFYMCKITCIVHERADDLDRISEQAAEAAARALPTADQMLREEGLSDAECADYLLKIRDATEELLGVR
jgi:hypothetical protein